MLSRAEAGPLVGVGACRTPGPALTLLHRSGSGDSFGSRCDDESLGRPEECRDHPRHELQLGIESSHFDEVDHEGEAVGREAHRRGSPVHYDGGGRGSLRPHRPGTDSPSRGHISYILEKHLFFKDYVVQQRTDLSLFFCISKCRSNLTALLRLQRKGHEIRQEDLVLPA